MKLTVILLLGGLVTTMLMPASAALANDPFGIGWYSTNVTVKIPVPGSDQAFYTSAEVRRKRSYGIATNAFEVSYQDRSGAKQSFAIEADKILPQLRLYSAPNSRWEIPRTTGGAACGTLVGVQFSLNEQTGAVEIKYRFMFLDYSRRYSPYGEPLLGQKGFEEQIYFKNLPGPFRPFDFSIPSDNKQQRFVLDFGAKKVVPILVLGYLGNKAIFTTVDYKVDFAKMSRGEFMQLRTYEVHAEMLRVATPEEFQEAALEYINDQSTLAKDMIVKANRAQFLENLSASMHRVMVGNSVDDSIASLRTSLSSNAAPSLALPRADPCFVMRQWLPNNYQPAALGN